MSKRSGFVKYNTLAPCISTLILIILSCNPSKPPPREYFIPREKLVEVLVDIHIVDAVQGTPKFRDISREYDSIDPYTNIFLHHETTKQAFDSTIAYYSKNPRNLISIYDEVIMKLTMINDSLQPVITE